MSKEYAAGYLQAIYDMERVLDHYKNALKSRGLIHSGDNVTFTNILDQMMVHHKEIINDGIDSMSIYVTKDHRVTFVRKD